MIELWTPGSGFESCIANRQAKTDAIFDALTAQSFDMYATVADVAEDPEQMSAVLRGASHSLKKTRIFFQ